jgi:hypothetical protein
MIFFSIFFSSIVFKLIAILNNLFNSLCSSFGHSDLIFLASQFDNCLFFFLIEYINKHFSKVFNSDIFCDFVYSVIFSSSFNKK